MNPYLKILFLLASLLMSVNQNVWAQSTFFDCQVTNDPTAPAPQNQSLPNTYSGSYDPAYLASFEPISFDIFFWIINRTDGTNDNFVTYTDLRENLKQLNDYYRPMGICFILKGFDYINNDTYYSNCNWSYLSGYAQSNGYVKDNSFNVYIPQSLAQGNGVTSYGNNKLAVAVPYILGWWEGVKGHTLAHELAHDFGLYHLWGNTNVGSSTAEHVTRDPLSPDYNALTATDKIHDTPAMTSFWSEAGLTGQTIFDIVNANDCTYIGSYTDNLGVPFELTPTDVGNVMAGTLGQCVIGFSVGQGIRIREYIADPINSNLLCIQAKRMNTPNIDLYIKDTPDDFGAEPNTVSLYTWISQDIWVRHQNDNVNEYQNPEYDPSTPNYVYVKITNRGCNSSTGSEQVKLYWSKASTSLTWDYNWSGNNFPNKGL